MKTTLRLEGLDCADCAAKIERMAKKLSGVNSASVNVMTTKMLIDHDETNAEGIVKEIVTIVKKIEPDVVVKKV